MGIRLEDLKWEEKDVRGALSDLNIWGVRPALIMARSLIPELEDIENEEKNSRDMKFLWSLANELENKLEDISEALSRLGTGAPEVSEEAQGQATRKFKELGVDLKEFARKEGIKIDLPENEEEAPETETSPEDGQGPGQENT